MMKALTKHYYWVPLWCQLVGLCGLVVSIIFTSGAYKDTNTAFDELHLTLKVPNYLLGMIITMTVLYSVALLLLLVPSTWRYQVETRGNKKSARAFLIVTGGLNAFAWVIQLLVVIGLIVGTLWLVGLIIANEASKQSIQYIEPVWNKLNGFYNNTVSVIDDFSTITGVQKLIIDKLPVDNIAPIFDKLDKGFQQLADKLDGTCPIVCIDLNGAWWLEEGNNCICNLDRIEAAQPYFVTAANNLWVGMIGYALMYFGLSWMLLHTAAQYARINIYRTIELVA